MIKRGGNSAGKRRYEEMLSTVGNVIRAWDPYGLLEGGAPKDEFDAEIASLVRQVPRIESEADAAAAIARVFRSSFGDDSFSSANVAHVGVALFVALRKSGFV